MNTVGLSNRAVTRRPYGGMIPAMRPLRNLAIVALAGWLAGCAAPSIDTPRTPAGTGDDIAELLAAADKATGSERAGYLLQAAAQLVRQSRFDQAERLLDDVGRMELDTTRRAHHSELSARLALERGDVDTAVTLLQAPELLRNLDSLPRPRQAAIGLLRARALALRGDHLASVQQRISVEPLLTAAQRDRSRAELWRSLMYVDSAELERYRDQAIHKEMRGWLELALIAKANDGSLDTQLARLDRWQREWRGHPGQELPGDLRLLREVAAARPDRVALLLPLSGQLGPFGEALRDGFMAALYEARARGDRTPTVRLYDTTGKDPVALYQQAVADGAQAVVGPLDKNQVTALQSAQLDVPILALNRGEQLGRVPATLFQFSLAPEDEAARVADVAFSEGHRRALVIAPEAENVTRELQAFGERWRQHGGQVVATARYRDQESLSSVIRGVLNLPQSQARAVELERLLGRNLQFQPRRRQDVDMVLMLAGPQQARSIAPTLAYHYAGDIPVYALSRSYTGLPQPAVDQDLEGMRFAEMPWILNNSPLKQQILNSIPRSASYLRFYAMGVDSYLLHSRMAQLARVPDSRLYGQTGVLSLDQHRVVVRELPLAVIRNGRPQEIASTALRLDDINPAMEGTRYEGSSESREARPRRFD